MRRLAIAVGFTLLFAPVVGCNSAKDVESRAEFLCKHGQLEAPEAAALPDGTVLADVVAAEDVAWMKAQEEKKAEAADEEDPFAALADGMMAALKPVTAAAHKAMAEHTECDVTKVEVEGDAAKVTVVQRRPDLGLQDGSEGLSKLGELVGMDSDEAREAAVSEWLESADGMAESEHHIELVKEENRWRIHYGLQARAEAERKAEVEALVAQLREKETAAGEKVASMEEAEAALEKFEVRAARFYKKDGFGPPSPAVDLTVHNGTEQAVARAYFHGALKVPGQEEALVEDDFDHKADAQVAPGAEAKWSLRFNRFSDWGKVEAPEAATLEVSVVRVDGPDGEPLWSAQDLAETREALEQYQGWISGLEAGEVDPAEVEKALEREALMN